MQFNESRKLGLFTCVLAVSIAVGWTGHAQAGDGYLSSEKSAQMLKEFQQMSRKGTTRQSKVVSSFLKKYDFACKPSAHTKQGAMSSAKATCHVFDESDRSPSPWPVLTLGIENRQIVAVSGTQIKTSGAWVCDAAKGRASICTSKRIPKHQRDSWSKQWGAKFRTAN